MSFGLASFSDRCPPAGGSLAPRSTDFYLWLEEIVPARARARLPLFGWVTRPFQNQSPSFRWLGDIATMERGRGSAASPQSSKDWARGGRWFAKKKPPVRSLWMEPTSVRGLAPGVRLTDHSFGQQLASVGGDRAAQQLAHHLGRTTLAIGSWKSPGGSPHPPRSPHELESSFQAPGLSMTLTDLRG